MATRDLQINIRRRDDIPVIDIAGDVDAAAEQALQSAYEEVSRKSRVIVLSFSRVDYINSTGIALIVAVLAQARSRGVHIIACGLSDHYRTIFEITRLADFMTIADNEASAVRGAEGSHHA